MAHSNFELLVPLRVEVVMDDLGLEQLGVAQVDGQVGVRLVAAVEEVEVVGVRKIPGRDRVKLQSSMQQRSSLRTN